MVRAWYLLLALTAVAWAQPTAYVALEPGASLSYLELTLQPGGTLTGRLVGNPGRHGGVAYAFEGTADHDGGTVRLEARARHLRPERGGEGPRLAVEAATIPREARLDPFGTARVRMRDAPGGTRRELAFEAIGTTLDASATLADGSLEVNRRAPLFYADPWRGLSFAWNEAGTLGVNLQRGLEHRRERGDDATGSWYEHRTTHVRTLSRTVVSVLHRHNTYTGGAHPNTVLSADTYLSDGRDWRPAPACEAARALRWPCDEAVLRDRVIEGLRARNAAWVSAGEVDADTPWLLDTFTVEPGGITVHFSPYAVGPYAQGPFEVHVPFERATR